MRMFFEIGMNDCRVAVILQRMERRDFLKACAAGCALGAPEVFSSTELKPRLYSRVQLLDESGRPLRAAALVVDRNYIFHYPFEGTPCFLLNLGKPTVRDVQLKTANGAPYRWSGGVGANRSIVGFSAICAHQLTYPTPQISFISYRDKSSSGRANVIHCCSEHSQYDPASGGKVLAGPAPQPLAAVLLEHDPKTDGLFAVGTLGGEMHDAFFAKYEFKLAMEPGGGRARALVSDRAVVKDLQNYCKQQIRC
jgi:Rieske Fe-S protein